MRTAYRSIGLLLLSLLLASCAFKAPGEVTPLSGLPDQFHLDQETTRDTRGAWWLAFDDPALHALIDEALLQNLELEQSLARLKQAEALLRSANASRLPTLTASGEATKSSQPSLAGDVEGETSNISVAAAFELDLWGKNTARSRGTRLDQQSSREAFKALLLTLSARVADAYYLVIEQRAQLQLAEQSIDAYRDSLEMVETRYRNGLVPAVDLYQARQNLASARATREARATAMKSAEHALAVLVGRYPGDEIAGTLTELPSPPVAFPTGLPSELLTRRPDLQAALMRVQATDSRRAAAIADRFPSINLLGSYGSSRSTFSVPTLEGEFWNLLAGVTLPLIDGGRRRAEVSRQEALLDESLARYRQAVLVAFQEVEDALVRNRNDELRLEYLEAAEEAAAASLRLSLERYRYGLSEYLPVITAQVFHFQIQGNLLSARRQLLADRISLARALGGEWLEAATESRITSNDKDQEP